MLGAPEEILPGVRHGAAFPPELNERVSSSHVEPAGALIDRMVPEGEPGWFETPGERFLERPVGRPGYGDTLSVRAWRRAPG